MKGNLLQPILLLSDAPDHGVRLAHACSQDTVTAGWLKSWMVRAQKPGLFLPTVPPSSPPPVKSTIKVVYSRCPSLPPDLLSVPCSLQSRRILVPWNISVSTTWSFPLFPSIFPAHRYKSISHHHRLRRHFFLGPQFLLSTTQFIIPGVAMTTICSSARCLLSL